MNFFIAYFFSHYLELLFPSVPVGIGTPVRDDGLKTEHLSHPAGICQS